MIRFKILAIMLLFAGKAFCQGKAEYSDFGIPTKNGRPFYEIIDSSSSKGKSQQAIYAAGRQAFAVLFKNSKAVIQVDDKGAGLIAGKGNMDIISTDRLGVKQIVNVPFLINFQAKDGKFRVQLYDIDADKVLKYPAKWRSRFFANFHSQVTAFIEDFKAKTIRNLGEDF